MAVPLLIGLLLGACSTPSWRSWDGAGPPPPPSAAQDQPPAPRGSRIDADVPAPPSAPPAWEARPVVADATRVPSAIYTVQRGDSLRGIGNKTGAGSEAIARANAIAAPFTIHPGQQLEIPGGRYHLVRQGETGIAIARAYGLGWSQVIAANGLEEPFVLRLGQRLLIPDTRPMSIAERAAAFSLDIDDIVTGGEPALAENARPARPAATAARILPPSAAVAEPRTLRGAFAWPVKGTVVKRFGAGASGERNDGIKIAIPAGTPILAAADGVVGYSGSDIQALGGLVILKHGDGWSTVYGHASQLLVARGQAVKKGQAIALSGASGYSDRPQLHFAMLNGRNPVDPVQRLPAP